MIFLFINLLLYLFANDTIFSVIAYGKVVYLVLEEKERSSLVVKIDKDLHKQIKATCAVEGISIREYIIELVNNDMQKRQNKNK